MRPMRSKRDLNVKKRKLNGTGRAVGRRWPNLWLVVLILVMTGCQSSGSEGRFPIALPTIARLARGPQLSPTPSQTPTITPTGRPTLTPTATQTLTPSPFPVSGQIDPITLDVTRPPTLRPEVTPPTPAIEWRPPPLAVPVSIHPQDHYWLARPIPSGSRNYDLEYYPFGTDVLIPEIPPFRIHHGVDFPNDEGTPVLAAGDGTVIWSGPRPSPRNGIDYYGNTVIIEHDWRWQDQPVYTLYAHTRELFVRLGDRVETGQRLGVVGGSGVVTGPHLHFEVRVGEDHYFAVRNPALWLAPYEGWGTLAGRFVDQRGEPISGATVRITPVDVEEDVGARITQTYADRRLQPDDIWRENFAAADLPAGTYRVEIEAVTAADGLIRRYSDKIRVLPGRTNFLVVQADYIFAPTPTPAATAILSGTITATVGTVDGQPIGTVPRDP